MKCNIEIWADSFHEGKWCCDCISNIASKNKWTIDNTFINGFQPQYVIKKNQFEVILTVYGSYRSWDPLPKKIEELIKWGKPDFIAYDSKNDSILFAVEETAATPTGNQPMQRCERQYGSARFAIPYWYLISEYSIKASDNGLRRDSIWPSIAALKLSIIRRTPCIVLHYSDIDNPEDYNSGGGIFLLFSTLFKILINTLNNNNLLYDLKDELEAQYKIMLDFILSQWSNIIDFLPSENLIKNPNTPIYISEIATGNTRNIKKINSLLVWPIIKDVPRHIQTKWKGKKLIKFDSLCNNMENDINKKKAYYLSDNASSGKPPTTSQINQWIKKQKQLFSTSKKLNPPAKFSLKLNDFPLTGTSDRRHLTTAKNIVYLYDSWNYFITTLTNAYPRLKNKLKKLENDKPVFVYVSNSLKPGRLFGDPYTGQLAAYSTSFGKFDSCNRIVVAYFPHQVHTQALINNGVLNNKGLTLMSELTDYIIFHGGVAISLSKNEVF